MYSHPNLLEEHAQAMNPDLDLDEIVRCPWCGVLVWDTDIDKPADYCSHKPVPSCLAGR